MSKSVCKDRSMVRRIALTTALALTFALALPCAAEQGEVSDEAMKASFLYNFTTFVEWPDDSFHADDAPFVVAMLGGEAIRVAFDQIIADKPLHRPVVVKQIDDTGTVPPCHVLFVAPGAIRRFKATEASRETHGVLTVGDAPGFAAAGGIVELVSERTKIGLKINLEAAKRAGLRIDSQMLALAEIVTR